MTTLVLLVGGSVFREVGWCDGPLPAAFELMTFHREPRTLLAPGLTFDADAGAPLPVKRWMFRRDAVHSGTSETRAYYASVGDPYAEPTGEMAHG